MVRGLITINVLFLRMENKSQGYVKGTFKKEIKIEQIKQFKKTKNQMHAHLFDAFVKRRSERPSATT